MLLDLFWNVLFLPVECVRLRVGLQYLASYELRGIQFKIMQALRWKKNTKEFLYVQYCKTFWTMLKTWTVTIWKEVMRKSSRFVKELFFKYIFSLFFILIRLDSLGKQFFLKFMFPCFFNLKYTKLMNYLTIVNIFLSYIFLLILEQLKRN